MEIISFDNICLSYRAKTVFERFSLHVGKGDKVALLGKSGSGKTSLFDMLLGFAVPESGDILFDRERVNARTAWDVRRKIAFVDQDVSIAEGNALDWIRSLFTYKVNSHISEYEETMHGLFEYFELEKDRIDKDITELSGGERQRLALIGAILLGRKVFLLDEITSALDQHLKSRTVDLMIKNKEWTVLVISHDHVWIDNPEVKVFDIKRQEWKR